MVASDPVSRPPNKPPIKTAGMELFLPSTVPLLSISTSSLLLEAWKTSGQGYIKPKLVFGLKDVVSASIDTHMLE